MRSTLQLGGAVPWKFDLQLFAINGSGGNGFPADIMAVIEQKNYLQTLIRTSLVPTLVFRPKKINNEDWFQARVGETKTFTRRGLIAPNTVPLNPANNTGLDNGMTADQRTFEQWTATLNEWPGYIPTNILGQEAFLGDLFIDNNLAMGQKAGNSLELICVQRVFAAYDSGDTFLVAAATGSPTTLHVDNINGFNLQYPQANLPSYQTPVATSSTNPISIVVIDATTKLIKAINTVTLATPDVSNISYMQNGGQAFGVSGVLTLASSITSCVTGDRVVAVDPSAASAQLPPTIGQPLNPIWKDGSLVVRPPDTNNVMIGTAAQMTAANVMNPSVMIPLAVSLLNRRGVPRLSNGLYGCAIDATLLSSFYSDTGFQRATMGEWDRGRYFTNGIIAKGWGVEFTDASQVPVYSSPAAASSPGSFNLRHAFVFGLDVIAEHPFEGARNAADIVARIGDVADERWVDRIKFRNLAALDDLGQVIKTVYDYVGDFQCGTDKSSNPSIFQTSDWQRYKRGVLLQAATQF
jgi:hypothetical protein